MIERQIFVELRQRLQITEEVRSLFLYREEGGDVCAQVESLAAQRVYIIQRGYFDIGADQNNLDIDRGFLRIEERHQIGGELYRVLPVKLPGIEGVFQLEPEHRIMDEFGYRKNQEAAVGTTEKTCFKEMMMRVGGAVFSKIVYTAEQFFPGKVSRVDDRLLVLFMADHQVHKNRVSEFPVLGHEYG